MKFLRAFVIFPILLYGIYTFWSRADRTAPALELRLNLQEVRAIGEKTSKGNVVGIQPFMYPSDYASEAHFYAKMDAYFYEAQRNRFLDSNTVVLLPEYLATWLVVANEKSEIYEAQKMDEVMAMMLFSNLGGFFQVDRNESVKEVVPYSLFILKAPEMARIYQQVFTKLAQKYQVTIVAGSILLPEPQIQNDSLLTIGKGNLYNCSIIFKPNGKMYDKIIKKAYPIQNEQPFISACQANEIPSFDLPIGRTGVLICADSWFSPAYQTLKNQQVSFILVPSFISGDKTQEKAWQGYSGFASPSEVQTDINKITEEEAWLKYAMAGRIKEANVSNGFNVFLRGKLWDLGSDGYSIIVKDNKLEKGKKVEGASIICVWL